MSEHAWNGVRLRIFGNRYAHGPDSGAGAYVEDVVWVVEGCDVQVSFERHEVHVVRQVLQVV